MQETKGPTNREKTIAGFEKLWVWQKAYNLMQEIHQF